MSVVKALPVAPARLGESPARAVMIGDRRLTDILGANRSGIYSIRVRGFRRR